MGKNNIESKTNSLLDRTYKLENLGENQNWRQTFFFFTMLMINKNKINEQKEHNKTQTTIKYKQHQCFIQ